MSTERTPTARVLQIEYQNSDRGGRYVIRMSASLNIARDSCEQNPMVSPDDSAWGFLAWRHIVGIVTTPLTIGSLLGPSPASIPRHKRFNKACILIERYIHVFS